MTEYNLEDEIKALEALLYTGENPTRATLAWERIKDHVKIPKTRYENEENKALWKAMDASPEGATIHLRTNPSLHYVKGRYELWYFPTFDGTLDKVGHPSYAFESKDYEL